MSTANPPAISPPRAAQAGGRLEVSARQGAVAGLALSALSLLIGFAVMPAIYGLVAFGGFSDEMTKPQVLAHIVFNCVANVAVMLSAIGLKGRIDQKITMVFKRVLLAHGALAFFTLVTRHYYSIPMLLTGGAASGILGVAIAYLSHRAGRFRVGILGPWHPMLGEDGMAFDHIEDPDADIGDYDLLIVTFAETLTPRWTATLSRALLAGKRVRHAAEYLEETRGVVSIEHFDLEHLPNRGLTSYRFRKRVLDIALVLVTAPVSLAVLIVVCPMILATMGRPVFFVQPRVGEGGRIFRMIKLRTMRAPGPVDIGQPTALGDVRVTPLGRWLRRFHIDELPQFLNVLTGSMSLVGPRPEQPGLTQAYAQQIPAFAYRQLVRPGITGWAQVRAGYAADLDETRVKLGYDLFYLKNFSFGLDLRIIVRTFWTLAQGGGVR
ncbi:MAG TPA: sugar transferase [Caulobacteraceae bacterium]